MYIHYKESVQKMNDVIDRLLTSHYAVLSNSMLKQSFYEIDKKQIMTSYNELMMIFKSVLKYYNDYLSQFLFKDLHDEIFKIKDNISAYHIKYPLVDLTAYNKYVDKINISNDIVNAFVKYGNANLHENEVIPEKLYEDTCSHALSSRLLDSLSINQPVSKDDFITTEYVEKVLLPTIDNFKREIEKFNTEYFNDIKNNYDNSIFRILELVRNYDNKYASYGITKNFGYTTKYLSGVIYTVFTYIKDSLSNILLNICKVHDYFLYIHSICRDLELRSTMESVYTQSFEADTSEIANRLLTGDASPFIEYANKVFNYHSNIFINKYEIAKTDDINSGSFESLIEKYDYDKDVYIDVMTIYQNIMDSLVVLTKNSDDYLMIFDDMIQKSGLSLSLEDRFANTLELIDHLKDYNEPIAGTQNSDMYFRIVNDIKHYPENMENIAGIIRDVYTHSQDLKKRFERRINGEFKDSQAVVELENYMTTFEEQFNYVVNITGSKLMARLKKLAYLSEAHLENISKNDDKPVGFVEFSSDDDYLDDVFDNEMEISKRFYESVIRDISKEYYKINAYNQYGVHIVLEADDANDNTDGDKGNVNTNDNKPSTKVTVNDNDDNSTTGDNKSSNVVGDVIKAVTEWFDNLLNKFDSLCERQGKKNVKWLNDNKMTLKTRRYVNVNASILPYEEKMNSKTVLNELSATAANVNSISSKMNTIKTEEDVVKALFPNIKVDDISKFSEICTNYFKVGNNTAEVQTYENRELGNLVNNSIIPFCENYYDSYVGSVKDNITKIKNSITNLNDKYTKESYVYSDGGTIYYEAEEDDGKTDNVKQKMDWVRKYTKLYCGSALNAIRDRNNDYFRLLSALVPKRKPTYSEK